MNMTFEMPVMLCGAMSFLPDGGNRINQIYCLNQDPSNTMYKGMVPAKMSCDEVVFQSLSAKPEDFPMQVTLVVTNKTSGGKTVQHAQAVKLPPVDGSNKPAKDSK
jgi:hypothetical protein